MPQNLHLGNLLPVAGPEPNAVHADEVAGGAVLNIRARGQHFSPLEDELEVRRLGVLHLVGVRHHKRLAVAQGRPETRPHGRSQGGKVCGSVTLHLGFQSFGSLGGRLDTTALADHVIHGHAEFYRLGIVEVVDYEAEIVVAQRHGSLHALGRKRAAQEAQRPFALTRQGEASWRKVYIPSREGNVAIVRKKPVLQPGHGKEVSNAP